MNIKQKRQKHISDDVKLQPEPVLDELYYRPVSLVDVYACVIENRKETSKLVKQLSVDLPLGELQHLKRVKSIKDDHLEIILGVKSYVEECCKLSEVKSRYNSLGKPFLVKVPAVAPETRKQYEESIQWWPVSFHEDKKIAHLLSGNYFSDDSLDIVYKHMDQAIDLARKAKEKNQKPVGAIIVDPVTDTVIAKSHDLSCGDHPLQHAVMVAVDLVARSQQGGIWNLEDEDMFYCDCTRSLTEEEKKSGPYLCTGYDLYVTREPCVMCSMALVHSRISRVFYGSTQEFGALGTRYKIHCQRGLNHHYEVFRFVYREECSDLFENG
ncbi:probable inactive tRNA-specific adenosine deaminase-like protein 3 isoform X2 [Gigantopelta aegis]|uniref:probable inactive tRNA-specific adenosine deaminase-like protein 3 isoform X2 n=1 Tax=Gigantopelta aegis TaxID=1735272 RepID=UPI001B888AAF|nr:probable inactive tRNA-specific adenosine deaminase-like protein 3 isoform X2 [Gigantopelta aegis]